MPKDVVEIPDQPNEALVIVDLDNLISLRMRGQAKCDAMHAHGNAALIMNDSGFWM